MVTSFQSIVYEKCKEIPRGKVSTYKYIATAINCKSAQAIGQALKLNPFAPIVPCHRVIASNLFLGGFRGEWGVNGSSASSKLKLLNEEGVTFDEDGFLMDHKLIYKFDN